MLSRAMPRLATPNAMLVGAQRAAPLLHPGILAATRPLSAGAKSERQR